MTLCSPKFLEDDRKMYREVKAFEKLLVFIRHLPVSQRGITHNAVFRERPHWTRVRKIDFT